MVVKAGIKYSVTFQPKYEDHPSQTEVNMFYQQVYPLYNYIESHNNHQRSQIQMGYK